MNQQKRTSLRERSWGLRLVIAFALMTIIPTLSLLFLLMAYADPSVVTPRTLGLVAVFMVALSGTGMFVLARILYAFSRFRIHLVAVAQGNLEHKYDDPGNPDLELLLESTESIVSELRKDRAKLSALSERLEKRVAERTHQLREANEALKLELAQRERAEKEAELKRRQLVQADKMVALGTLVSGVAHEVNNPNNTVMLSAEALSDQFKAVMPLLDRLFKDSPELQLGNRPYAEVREEMPLLLSGISKSSQRIAAIVNRLKDFSRQSSDDLSENADLNAVIQAAALMVGHLSKAATKRITVTPTPGLPVIKGNAQHLEQVFVNLLQNALQALPEDGNGGVSVTTLNAAEEDSVVAVVRDEGRGIPREDIPRLVEPFFTTRREHGGTGLGLSVSSEIVTEHRGTMSFDSEVGKGTTVTLKFPAQKEAS